MFSQLFFCASVLLFLYKLKWFLRLTTTTSDRESPIICCGRNLLLYLVILHFCVHLFNGYRMLTYLAAHDDKTSRQANQLIPKSQIVENSDAHFTEKQLDDFLNVNANCTSPYVSLDISVKDEGDILLVFSTLISPEGVYIQSLICTVHFVSAPRSVMSMVLLEHTLCNGGVIVVLSDTSRRRRWRVCSVLQAPGPDFLTSSNVADISVEVRDVTDLFQVTISVKAVEKPEEAELVLRHLSTKEGTILLFS